MDDKRDVIKELKEFKDQFVLNKDDTKKAERIAEDLYVKKGNISADTSESTAIAISRRRNIVIVSAAFLIVCVAFLSIFLPLVLKENPVSQIKYYDYGQIETDVIDDIDTFIKDNELNCRYYKGDSTIDDFQAGYVKENRQLVFLVQQSVAVNVNGMDTIVLNIVLTEDKFQAFESFAKFTDEIVVNGIKVQYRTAVLGKTQNIYAEFQDSSIIYYIQIFTSSGSSAEEKLSQYISNVI